MLLRANIVPMLTKRTFKNFGHKRQPIPLVTTLWHGALTLTFTGMCLNWDKISTWIFGKDSSKSEPDWDEDL
ncbi:Uncharacterized protein OBRU01_21437 [Operophtera brumata]|uniref:Uncharacterized protein n=1 Tax=Operophtera brumata TaxID=104452 RepID=A0A0L7KT46_OPEBR|nr:Uncharacterized protein OBRU01_21437 [Operophtera brumata]